MRLTNEKNRHETAKVDVKTIKKAKYSQEYKQLNARYLNQLEANNHYVLGYN